MAAMGESKHGQADDKMVNYMGGKPTGAQVEKTIMELASGHPGLGALSAWTRTDLGTKSLRTTMRKGPEWSCVKYRSSSDVGTGEVLAVDHAKDITRSLEHAPPPISGGARNLQTVFFYDDDNRHDGP